MRKMGASSLAVADLSLHVCRDVTKACSEIAILSVWNLFPTMVGILLRTIREDACNFV